MRTLEEMLIPGEKVKVFYNDENPNNQIRHIRAIVDKEVVVYRVWNKKTGWNYGACSKYNFEYMYEKGRLS